MPFVSRRPLEDMLDPRAPERCARRIADDGGDRMEELTRRFTPIDSSFDRGTAGRPRGTAKASVHRTPVERRVGLLGLTFQVRVRTEDPVFPYIEWRTKPHIIRPRRDRGPATVLETGRPRGTVHDGRAALSWRGPGGRVFAKIVHHPGTQGQHPFSRAALQVEGELRSGRLARPALEQFERELARSWR